MKIKGYNIFFSLSVLFKIAEKKGFKKIDDFSKFSDLSPFELLEIIKECMIVGERKEGREFNLSVEELADILTPSDLKQIIEYLTLQGTETEDKKKVKKKRFFFRS